VANKFSIFGIGLDIILQTVDTDIPDIRSPNTEYMKHNNR